MNSQESIGYSLSDADIRKKLGKDTRVITYPELKNYKSSR